MKDDLVKKLLKGAYYPDSVFEDASKDNFKIDEAIESLNDSQKEHYSNLLRGDIEASIKDKVTKDRDGALYDHIHRGMKKSGMDIEPIREMQITDKIKEYDKFLKGKYGNKDNESKIKQEYDTLQEKHLALENTLTDKEESWKGKYDQVVKDESAKSLRKEVDLTMHKHFQTIPENRLVGGKRADGFYAAVKSVIESKYDVTLDKGDVVYLEKGTQTRAKGKKDGRDNFLSTDDVVRNELKNLSLWVESNGSGGDPKPAPTPGTPTPSGDPKEKSAAVQRIEQEIADAVK